MITAPAFAGKRWGVLGLARTGRAAAAALLAAGGAVWAWDDDARARAAYDGTLVDLAAADLAGLAGVVVSPGVPPTAPIFAAAARAGVPVLGDAELFSLARAAMPPCRIVGITGTNGKSTTTALLHHLCTTAGLAATMAGNIGAPIMAQAPLPAGGVWVLELSSYQLEITHSLACDIAILTNITPDHLERHGSMAAYAAAKARLFAQAGAAATAIIGRAAQSAFAPAPAGAIIIEAVPLPGDPADWPGLAGPHNRLNAAAAVAAARALGIADAVIAAGLASYRALPHRMQPVGRAGGLLWVNDSKATNPDSTAPALAAWPPGDGRKRLHWIAGGRAKRDAAGCIDLSALAPHLGNVAHAYLIGEAAAQFAATLAGAVPVTISATIAQAVADARGTARPGDVVLFSPAAASFDQFSDFEARGRAFAALVEGIGP